MIADLDPVLPAELLELAHRSAELYPTFVSELASEAQRDIDLRDAGVIAFEEHPIPESEGIRAITAEQALALEPKLAIPPDPAYTMRERAVDPRDLVAALIAALQKREVKIVTGEAVSKILVERRPGDWCAHGSWFLRRTAHRELRRSMGGTDRGRQVADPAGEGTHGGAGVSRGVSDEFPRSRTEPGIAPCPAVALVLHHPAQQWTLRCGQHG